MNGSVADLTRNALDLSEDQKITLAHKLLSSIEPPESAEIDAAWNSEILHRISRFKNGQIKTIPAGQVFAELDARLQ